MIETNLCRVSSLIVHYIGNKSQNAELKLSNSFSGMDGDTEKLLLQHISTAFKTPDFFQFQDVDNSENECFNLIKQIFEDNGSMIENSHLLAQRLFESVHQSNIRSGELLIFLLDNIVVKGSKTKALALIKSERKHPFLFTEEAENAIELYSFKGIDPMKVDKACLVLNTSAEDGYQVLAIDTINRYEEAKYWIQDFLQLKRRETEFSKTKSVLEVTKEFIQAEASDEENPLPRLESAGLLNKSMAYFSETDEFAYEKFSEVVFGDAEVGNKFREFAQRSESAELLLEDNFAISQDAVRKNKKFFKHVLKLDKNFHVYIHGNSDLIERGTDPDTGKKYYKLYFEEES